MRKDGDTWTDVRVPNSVKALVVLNLQSYGGGRDLWGLRCNTPEDRKKGWSQPIFNDGLFEVGRGLTPSRQSRADAGGEGRWEARKGRWKGREGRWDGREGGT